ncbi:ABC transporter permease [Gordonia alkanivorans]|uniref:ABC transporter permease n=1 Tax=Gordonia alkanivorans TaxID=84096 RepID=UPI002449938C|nr:ABC transporter permease [Gordonia alkanivorans]MDH3047824.1 ABC transporter permease [Gordonia alkanivorans]
MTSTEMGITANEEKVASGKKTPPAMVMLVGLTAGLGVILVLLLMVFILPSLKSGAHDLRVGVVGAPAAVSSFERSLATAAPDAYEPQRYDSEAGLRDAIEHREVVGGFVVDEAGVHTLVASAGSASISGSLTGTAQAVGQATGEKVTVEDVVPLPEGDPTGIGIGGLAFPLVFGGIVPVVAFRKIFPRSNGWYLTGLITFSAVGGVIVASTLTFGFGSIDAGLWSTGFWAVAGSIALGVAALAIPLAGLQNAFGAKGFTIGAMVMMFLGNPLAGIAGSAAWLPSGLGTVGQILPPGAAGTLVRSAAYFGGAAGLTAGLTLATWIVVGLVLFVTGMRRAAVSTPEAGELAS